MKQEVARKHKAEKWALDDVVYHTEVTTYERVEQVRYNFMNIFITTCSIVVSSVSKCAVLECSSIAQHQCSPVCTAASTTTTVPLLLSVL
jgi:hypothetical protein